MYRALIVSSRPEVRTQLRQLLLHGQQFRDVAATSHIGESIERTEAGQLYDIYFLGSEFSYRESTELIHGARSAYQGVGKQLFILILQSGQQTEEQIVDSMMGGFHAFICEPHSMESISEILELAKVVSSRDSLVRLRAATGLALSDLHPQNREGNTPGARIGRDLWKDAEDSRRWYKELTNESLTLAVQRDLSGTHPQDRLELLKALKQQAASLSQTVGRMFTTRLTPLHAYRSRTKKPD